MAFLLINYNRKKELKRLKDIEDRKKMPNHYYGDDTVWQLKKIELLLQ